MADDVSIEQMRNLLANKQAAKPATPVATLTKGKDGQIDVTSEVIDLLYPPVLDKVTETVKPALIETIVKGIESEAAVTNAKVDALVKDTKAAIKADEVKQDKARDDFRNELLDIAKQVRPIEVRTETTTVAMDGVMHTKFELLLATVAARLPVFMVGPAGTGKTAGAEQVSTALSIPFYAMSVGSQTSKSDIFGFVNATGNFLETSFYKAYKDGGVFLLDEADAGNANVLVGLNAALSNGYVFFPNGETVKMHNEFRMIATANTFGNGASRQYVGRNQLDAATLDRFTVITWDIDDRIEESIAASKSPTYGDRWLKVVRAVRDEAINKLELRAVVSPRATLRGSTLLEAGVTFEDTVQVALIANMPEAEREVLLNLAIATWAKSDIKKVKTQAKAKPKIGLDDLMTEFGVDDDEPVDADGSF